jgi:glutamine synthetase
LHGIDANLAPPAPCDFDLYDRHRAGAAMPERLPRDLCSALHALRGDAELRQRLGQPICSEFLAIKLAEWDAYTQHVSEWEFARYARNF